jgi:hypothetical protein
MHDCSYMNALISNSRHLSLTHNSTCTHTRKITVTTPRNDNLRGAIAAVYSQTLYKYGDNVKYAGCKSQYSGDISFYTPYDPILPECTAAIINARQRCSISSSSSCTVAVCKAVMKGKTALSMGDPCSTPPDDKPFLYNRFTLSRRYLSTMPSFSDALRSQAFSPYFLRLYGDEKQADAVDFPQFPVPPGPGIRWASFPTLDDIRGTSDSILGVTTTSNQLGMPDQASAPPFDINSMVNVGATISKNLGFRYSSNVVEYSTFYDGTSSVKWLEPGRAPPDSSLAPGMNASAGALSASSQQSLVAANLITVKDVYTDKIDTRPPTVDELFCSDQNYFYKGDDLNYRIQFASIQPLLLYIELPLYTTTETAAPLSLLTFVSIIVTTAGAIFSALAFVAGFLQTRIPYEANKLQGVDRNNQLPKNDDLYTSLNGGPAELNKL